MSMFDEKYTLQARISLVVSQLIYKKSFLHFGKHSRILKPLRIANSRYMKIGNNVYIDKFAYLCTEKIGELDPVFVIEDNVKIGNYNHIVGTNCLIIEKDVLTADRVYISDNYHEYIDTAIPIKSQGVKSKGPVIIGEGSWIGDNVSIISCKIGKHCIIGANSVVIKDVPDYSVAVGCPARIVKKYNFDSKKWDKCL